MKWMSRPSISVMKCGSDFRCASHLFQSYSVPQYWMSFCIVPSCTPCVSPTANVAEVRREADSETNSRSGQRVAAMRRRSSSISSCGKLTVKGRIELASAAAAGSDEAKLNAAAPAEVASNAVADVARNSRRFGAGDGVDMISLLRCAMPLEWLNTFVVLSLRCALHRT